MNFLIPFFTSSFVTLIIIILKNHIIKVPPNVYVLEERFSLRPTNEKIRVISGTGFMFRNPKLTKCITLKNRGNYINCNGILKDGSSYEFSIEYKLELNPNPTTLQNLYQKLYFGSYHTNDMLLLSQIKLCIEFSAYHLFRDKTYYDFTDLSKKDKILKEFFDNIKNSIGLFVDFTPINTSFVFNENNKKDILFPYIALEYEKLSNAGYNEQQINQILKAGEKNIYLNNINPLVPSEVFRKIRNIYNKENLELQNYLTILATKTKSNEDITEVCKKILSL